MIWWSEVWKLNKILWEYMRTQVLQRHWIGPMVPIHFSGKFLFYCMSLMRWNPILLKIDINLVRKWSFISLFRNSRYLLIVSCPSNFVGFKRFSPIIPIQQLKSDHCSSNHPSCKMSKFFNYQNLPLFWLNIHKLVNQITENVHLFIQKTIAMGYSPVVVVKVKILV